LKTTRIRADSFSKSSSRKLSSYSAKMLPPQVPSQEARAKSATTKRSSDKVLNLDLLAPHVSRSLACLSLFGLLALCFVPVQRARSCPPRAHRRLLIRHESPNDATQELGGGISQSDMPPRLQNIFNTAPTIEKGYSRAETDLLTLHAYAPNWRPNQQVSHTSLPCTHTHIGTHACAHRQIGRE